MAGSDLQIVSDETLNITVDIILRFKDDFALQYNGNKDNEIQFDEIVSLLSKAPVTCYFQRLKEFEQVNKVSGRVTRQSTHRILVDIGDEKAIEGTLSLFNDEYSYRIVKLKQITFFNRPSKSTIKRTCWVHIKHFKDYKGFTSSEEFKNLYEEIDKLSIPVMEVNKEKDRQIWKNYVLALKKLIKQKEQVWKIQKIGRPYFETKEKEKERSTYIDIKIDEADLVRALQKNIASLFNSKDIEDYAVFDDKAFIEFKNYRILTQDEHIKLKELGEELFYEVSHDTPFHYISGDLTINVPDTQAKLEVFKAIAERLLADYQLSVSIDESGLVTMGPEDSVHLAKIIDDNYKGLLSIRQNNQVQLRVNFSSKDKFQVAAANVTKQLSGEGFSNHKISIEESKESIVLEIGTWIPPYKFSPLGLQFVKSISRFELQRGVKLKPLDGLEIVGDTYHVINPSKDVIDQVIKLLGSTYPGVRSYRKPTLYFFSPMQSGEINELRTFKTKTDLQGKSEFIISSSILKITANDEADFKEQVQRIKSAGPGATIEIRPFTPSYQIQFKTEIESSRQSIIAKIQNEIRNIVQSTVEFDVIKSWAKVLFSFRFKTTEDRDLFKESVKSICQPYEDILKLTFETELGRSVYELLKNEKLELEKEKEVAGSVRRATFVYITPEQRQQLNEAIEKFGDEARFFDGITIGSLVHKDRDTLRFLINSEFDTLLNARQADRIDTTEIEKGFIKPIFPGELTNINRMIRAMRKVTDPGVSSGYPVNKNLSNFLFDPNEARWSADTLDERRARVLSNLNEPLLRDQPKQLDAVVKSIAAGDLALIQGPPGTGKTTVIAEIIWQVLLEDPKARILITSQTNLAVDNALERLSGKKLVRPIRIGNTEKFENEGKVYSNERIKKWTQSKTGSLEEQNSEDNAIREWIENIKSKCSDEQKYSSAVEKWKKGLGTNSALIKNTFSDAYYKNVNVFAATCSECGSRNFAETFQSTFQKNSETTSEPEFDVVIMDEASKATPPELVLPLTLGRKVIIIGDHKQLPPMIDEQEFSEALDSIGASELIENWTREDYKISQFEKLFKNSPKAFVTSLDTQFRMHEQIMKCISQFYTDQEELEHGLLCGIKNQMDIPDFNVSASRWHGIKAEPFLNENNHVIWVSVESPEIKVGTSYENEGEIKAIQTVLKVLTKAAGYEEYHKQFKKEEDKEIGIISFYVPQMKKIRSLLYPHFSAAQWRNFELHKFENEFQIPFRINTVDRFQGMERNIIIISTVRSNKRIQIDSSGKKTTVDNIRYPSALGFARELQRINVGFSRAKRLLIVVGNEKHFANKEEYANAISQMHVVDIKQLENLVRP